MNAWALPAQAKTRCISRWNAGRISGWHFLCCASPANGFHYLPPEEQTSIAVREKPAFSATCWRECTWSCLRALAPGHPAGERNNSAWCNRYCAGFLPSIRVLSRHQTGCAARAVSTVENRGQHRMVAAAGQLSLKIRKHLEATYESSWREL